MFLSEEKLTFFFFTKLKGKQKKKVKCIMSLCPSEMTVVNSLFGFIPCKFLINLHCLKPVSQLVVRT